MMTEDLARMAATLVAGGKGILAADESVATVTRRFDPLGIESTEESRCAYREMLFTTPGAAEFVSGAILYDETIRQMSSDETPLARVLSSEGIVPGIKVDTGAEPLAGSPEETVTEGLDGLRERLAEYHDMGARFAKWRAVIRITPTLPSQACVSANAHALARYAALCQEQHLVPIVEPEVLMNGAHTIERCEEVTGAVLHAVFHDLFEQGVSLESMLLKPSMVIHCGQGLRAAGFRAGSRDRDAPLPAPARARGGAGNRVPVGRPEGPVGHRTSERDQPSGGARALEAQLLLRPRAPGCGHGGVAGAGCEPESRPGGVLPPGPLQRRGDARRVHRCDGGRTGERSQLGASPRLTRQPKRGGSPSSK
jgi:fructose-bisphosphate aldolase class 1